MKVGVELITNKRLIEDLQKRVVAAYGNCPDVLVGYKGDIAFRIHENMELFPPGMRLAGQPRWNGNGHFWDPQGMARPKFLEEPARTNADHYGQIFVMRLKEGKAVKEALFAAGEQLKTDSQAFVPVDTGKTRDSAFVRYDMSPENK